MSREPVWCSLKYDIYTLLIVCLPWTLFGSGDNAPHLVQPTASCLISHADEKIKTISSLLTPIVLSWCGFFFFQANQQEIQCFFSTSTTNKIPSIHFSAPGAVLTEESSIMQLFSPLSAGQAAVRGPEWSSSCPEEILLTAFCLQTMNGSVL